jgi:hypothetical protein
MVSSIIHVVYGTGMEGVGEAHRHVQVSDFFPHWSLSSFQLLEIRTKSCISRHGETTWPSCEGSIPTFRVMYNTRSIKKRFDASVDGVWICHCSYNSGCHWNPTGHPPSWHGQRRSTISFIRCPRLLQFPEEFPQTKPHSLHPFQPFAQQWSE